MSPGPGVEILTSTRSAPASVQRSAASTYFVCGQTERGVTNKAIKVTSMSDVERYTGAYIATGSVYRDLQTFFEEGGATAYISRVVGASATIGAHTFVDKAGTPLSTLSITALSAGPWSANVTVEVQAGTQSGTYKLLVNYTGTGGTGTETYDNLVTPGDAVSALQNSSYVRATDLGSATAAPNNQPAVVTATALSAGTDDHASITSSNYTAALANFIESLGAGAVSIPGQTSAAVGAGLVAHAVNTNRIALTSVAASQSVSQAIAAVASLRSAVSAGLENVGLFFPWVSIPDGKGGTLNISPEGFVAACRSRAQEAEGPARAPAGVSMGQANYVVGLEQELSGSNGSLLNDNGVSAIRTKIGLPTLYGWRSLSLDDANYHLLTSRDTMNYVAVTSKTAMEQYVFRTIDGKGQLFSDMTATELGILEPLRLANQLYERIDANGNQLDPGYSVRTDGSINTPQTIAANQARIAVAIRPSPSAELIHVDIIKVSPTGSV